jgi:pimeloyl-ACP methyl ester carboxylesterase
MHVILIPGLWLDGPSWDKVLPGLEAAGLIPHALTLPGMESRDADRSKITLSDHVDAVVAEIDAVDPADGPVIVVGHSAGAGIASAVVDARPDRVRRVVYIGGFPAADGEALVDGFTAVNGEVALPDWSAFDDADLTDLDEAARAEFRARAIPSPEQVIDGPVRLSDDRRYDVPVTVICPEFTSDTLRGWIEAGMPPVQEFTKIRDLDYVDLPTGHWPQFTRPDDLARVIADAANRQP